MQYRTYGMEIPTPALQRFERVLVKEQGPRCGEFHGERGTVIWLDSYYVRRNPARPDQWVYIVHLPTRDCWRTFFESDLESEGTFDAEGKHLGQRAEFSFDITRNEDNDWIEGSFRLPNEFWKVMIFNKDDVPDVRHETSRWQKPTIWEQEITGVVFRLPRAARVDREYILRTMSHALGCHEWVDVKGPDSMVLR